jgi:hypothetical protein
MNENFISRDIFKSDEDVKIFLGFEESGIICGSNLNHAIQADPKDQPLEYECSSHQFVPPN